MRFQTPLIPARLDRRYKRFLADITLEDSGAQVTAHCPNPGAMLGLAEPGRRIWVEPVADPRRKLRYAWRLVELEGGGWAGIDTNLPNRVVLEALEARQIPTLEAYDTLRPEVPYGTNSRVDFVLGAADGSRTYVEVKNVTLRRKGAVAEFPDCVTARGAKHLAELAQVARSGQRAAMLYLVQRTDCLAMTIAADLDPVYARAVASARMAGVEMLCHAARISLDGITIGPALPFDAAWPI